MKRGLLMTLFCIATTAAMAVPSFPELIIFQQPGNREISLGIYLKGDEKVHWAETRDGYSLLYGNDGSLMYATRDESGDMVTSQYMATEINERSSEVAEFLKKTPKHLRFSQSQVDGLLAIWNEVELAKKGPKTMSDVIGEKKFLVILFGFNDQSFQKTRSKFLSLFNQVNYNSNGKTGSVYDYYHDVSDGLFSLQVDVVGPYIGTENTAYYGNTDYGYQAFAREAVDSAAKDVDFSDYDNDNDGYIDGLHIIFAGHGEEAGGGADCIWSHKWNIFDPPTYNNTVIDVYSCSPELSGASGSNITNIGVICHELGHVFGAPDYYDTDYSGSGGEYPGLGTWDIMSSGSWNNSGITPAQHNPYTKIYIYRWESCDTIDSTPGRYEINPAYRSDANFFRINTSTQGDFFLLENRQKVKWDRFLSGHGMLVYHVHPNVHGRSVSNASHPQQLYILAQTSPLDTFPSNDPDSYGIINSSTTPLPTTNNMRDTLTDFSIPCLRPWSRQRNYTPIYNISENSSSQKIFFTIQKVSPDVTNAEAEGVSNQSIEVRWNRYGSYNTLVVVSGDDNLFGIPEGDYNIGDTVSGGGVVVYYGSGSHVIVDSLNRNQTYHFRIFTRSNRHVYSDGVDAIATTLNCNESVWETEDFESTAIGDLPSCWEGEWKVGSLMGQHSLCCPSATANGTMIWSSVKSRPFSFDTIKNAVLHFRLHFGEGCGEETMLIVETRSNSSSQWTALDTTHWNFGGATWQNIYIPLNNIGQNGRIRFSVYHNGTETIAIDDIDIQEGNMLYASSDDNGDISPRGYSIITTDSVALVMTPLPGYAFKALLDNGTAVSLQLINRAEDGSANYMLPCKNTHHTLYAMFERKNSIDNVANSNPHVYPNPTSGIITIEAPTSCDLYLYNIRGQLVKHQKHTGNTSTINISSLQKGIYILRLNNESIKIVKE